MEELVTRLKEVEDSYEDFVGAISQYARKKSSRVNAVLEYMRRNPDANSSDVIYFVSSQDDFLEDATYDKVVGERVL